MFDAEVMATFDGRSCEALAPTGACTEGRTPCRSETVDPLEAIVELARVRLVDGM
jgi:hypothetical protein